MKATGIFDYLNKISTLITLKCPVKNASQFLDLDVLDEALKVRAAKKITDTYKNLDKSTATEN